MGNQMTTKPPNLTKLQLLKEPNQHIRDVFFLPNAVLYMVISEDITNNSEHSHKL